jgi:Uma2 family endonuclease
MSTTLKQTTVDEFLSWAEGREGRWELHDGVPVMMSPERSLHAETKAEAYVARATDEPDASVVCGPRAPPDAIEIDNPVIVVEVVSPNTAAIDHGRKLSGYFSHPSVQHYPILDPDRRVVIHHKRGAGDAIETRVLTGGFARLDPPGFEVAVEALFPPA